jgi:hypothetical protein
MDPVKGPAASALRIFTATELRVIAEEVYEQRIADMEERVRDTVSILEWRSFHDRISALELETANLRLNCPGYHPPAPSPAEPRCAYVYEDRDLCFGKRAEHGRECGIDSHDFTPAPPEPPCGKVELAGTYCHSLDHEALTMYRSHHPDCEDLNAKARADAAEVKRLRAQVERVRALLETVPYGCEYDAIVKIKDALRDEE